MYTRNDPRNTPLRKPADPNLVHTPAVDFTMPVMPSAPVAAKLAPVPVTQTPPAAFVRYLPPDKIALATEAKDKSLLLKIDAAMKDGNTEQALKHAGDLSTPQMRTTYTGVIATRKHAKEFAKSQGHLK